MFDKSAKYICNYNAILIMEFQVWIKKLYRFLGKSGQILISRIVLMKMKNNPIYVRSKYDISREFFHRKLFFFKTVKCRKFQIGVAIFFSYVMKT